MVSGAVSASRESDSTKSEDKNADGDECIPVLSGGPSRWRGVDARDQIRDSRELEDCLEGTWRPFERRGGGGSAPSKASGQAHAYTRSAQAGTTRQGKAPAGKLCLMGVGDCLSSPPGSSSLLGRGAPGPHKSHLGWPLTGGGARLNHPLPTSSSSVDAPHLACLPPSCAATPPTAASPPRPPRPVSVAGVL